MNYCLYFYVRFFSHTAAQEKKEKKQKPLKRQRKGDCEATKDGLREPMPDKLVFPWETVFQIHSILSSDWKLFFPTDVQFDICTLAVAMV